MVWNSFRSTLRAPSNRSEAVIEDTIWLINLERSFIFRFRSGLPQRTRISGISIQGVWGLRWVRLVIIRSDPTGEGCKSGAVNYVRWEVIPLLDGARKK